MQPPQPTGDQTLDLAAQAAYFANLAVMSADPSDMGTDFLAGIARDLGAYVAQRQGAAGGLGPPRMQRPMASDQMSYPSLPDVAPPAGGMY